MKSSHCTVFRIKWFINNAVCNALISINCLRPFSDCPAHATKQNSVISIAKIFQSVASVTIVNGVTHKLFSTTT